MFKIARATLPEVQQVLRDIYRENPQHWPNKLSAAHFDGGLWAVRDQATDKVAGFVGWQQRRELDKHTGDPVKVGYYSVGVLPEYRRQGLAKEAISKLLAIKAAGVDRVRALIVASNEPSLALADALGVEKIVKHAGAWAKPLLYAAGGIGVAGLENKLVADLLPDQLKTVNLGLGGITGLLAANPATRATALGSLAAKQMGLFGIGAIDNLRRQQQSLVDANLGVAGINRQTADIQRGNASSANRNMMKFLIPALLAGGGIGYLGYDRWKKNRKKPKRYRTTAEKGRSRPSQKIKMDIPASAFPPGFFESLTNIDDQPNVRTRMLERPLPKAASAARGIAVAARTYCDLRDGKSAAAWDEQAAGVDPQLDEEARQWLAQRPPDWSQQRDPGAPPISALLGEILRALGSDNRLAAINQLRGAPVDAWAR